MEVLYKRCCGIDIHKNMMVACVFTSVRKKEIRQFSTMTEDILQLVSWLKETNCEMAAMESTGSYWKPIYNIFEEEQIPIMVVNAQHIKGVPGRKTDVKDAEWIADLVRHGLVKASYIPNRKQRELREITRYRQEIIEERARELNRIQAVLEGCNVKLGSVITDISGKSGMAILKAIVSGETDPVVLSELAEGRARDKIPEMQKSLQGRISGHQQKMLKHQLGHIESLTALILDLDAEMDSLILRDEKIVQLQASISKNWLFGNGLGAAIQVNNGYVEYTYYDIMNKMGLVGLLLFVAPFGLIAFFTCRRKQNPETDSDAILQYISLSSIFYFMVITYFNPCMNTTIGISCYVFAMAVANVFRKKEMLI